MLRGNVSPVSSPDSALQSQTRGLSGDGGNRTHARFLPSSPCGRERWFCGCYPPEPWEGRR